MPSCAIESGDNATGMVTGEQLVLNVPRDKLTRSIGKGTKIMLLALGVVVSFLLGVLVGRVWEIRQRILLAGPASERTRPVELHAAAGGSQFPPRTDSQRLADLDREMQDLIKAVAIKARHTNATNGRVGRVNPTSYRDGV